MSTKAHSRALRAAALRLAEAQWARTDAIVGAHRAGLSMPEIGRQLGIDAFDVRDELVRAGALAPLQPKEAAGRAGSTPDGASRPGAATAAARSGG